MNETYVNFLQPRQTLLLDPRFEEVDCFYQQRQFDLNCERS
jgi:hypothetical protein